VLASAVALAADFVALKETVSIAGSWRGRVTMDVSDAHAFAGRAGAPEALWPILHQRQAYILRLSAGVRPRLAIPHACL